MMDIYRDSSLTQEKFEVLLLDACDNFYFEVITDLSVITSSIQRIAFS